jgi:homoserine O-acetyltransferase/O-succinyltransferase
VAKKEKQHLTLRANLQIFGVENRKRAGIFAMAERQRRCERTRRFPECPRMKNAIGESTNMKTALSVALLIGIFCGASESTHARPLAAAQAAKESPGEGAQQFAALGDLKLRSGAVIHDFRLGYRTFGQLNAAKSNAILWPTWLGGKTQELMQFIGPDKVVDSTKYFVVLVDAIGNGVSTSPSNSETQARLAFPEFTIRDMVESEHRLATEVLHLAHLHAVMGISMGGMQTFEWVVAYPDFMDAAVPMAGSPQSTSYDKLLWTAEMDALRLDPEWKDGQGTKPMTGGFAVYNEIGNMNVTSPAYRVAKTSPQDFPQFIEQTRTELTIDAATACDAIRQRQAINALDIPGELGETMEQATKSVRAKLLVVISPQDHMVNPTPASAFAGMMGTPVLTLDSPCGHESLECISVGPIVAKFLADPASVQSMTLHATASQ